MLNYNFYQYSVNINPLMFDDGHGDYNRSYERDYDDFDYADLTISITPTTPPTTATIITAILKRNAAKAKKKLLKIF